MYHFSNLTMYECVNTVNNQSKRCHFVLNQLNGTSFWYCTSKINKTITNKLTSLTIEQNKDILSTTKVQYKLENTYPLHRHNP